MTGTPRGISFDRIADKFDATRSYPEDVMQSILAALVSGLPSKGRVLDAGVGTGRLAVPLQAKGYQVVGVDISGRMLERAWEKGLHNIVRGDLCALPFTDRSFEAALSVHVLHLIEDWRCALGEIARVAEVRLLSVAFNKLDSPAEEIREFYGQKCTELGFKVAHPGMRERELPDLVPPDRDTPITVHETELSVEDIISACESRTYSDQWFVPENIHNEAIETMKERFGDLDQVIERERISLLQWDMTRVRRFVAASGHA